MKVFKPIAAKTRHEEILRSSQKPHQDERSGGRSAPRAGLNQHQSRSSHQAGLAQTAAKRPNTSTNRQMGHQKGMWHKDKRSTTTAIDAGDECSDPSHFQKIIDETQKELHTVEARYLLQQAARLDCQAVKGRSSYLKEKLAALHQDQRGERMQRWELTSIETLL